MTYYLQYDNEHPRTLVHIFIYLLWINDDNKKIMSEVFWDLFVLLNKGNIF